VTASCVGLSLDGLRKYKFQKSKKSRMSCGIFGVPIGDALIRQQPSGFN